MLTGRLEEAVLQLKRAYESASPKDGERILVERLWPRGVSREDAALAEWWKEIAPSQELRKWYGHQVERWPEFQRRYRAELKDHEAMVQELRKRAQHGTVTLVYGARDEEHNSARVLRDVVLGKPVEAA